MSDEGDDLNKKTSEFIDAWLLNPDACDFEQSDTPELLELLRSRLRNAWEHGRDAEWEALLRLKASLLSYLAQSQVKSKQVKVEIFRDARKQSIQALLAKIETLPLDHPIGQVTVKRVIYRSVEPCLYCKQYVGKGWVSVQHEDGRSVRFSLGAIHYIDAEHPITPEDLDVDDLEAIMVDVPDNF